MNRINAALLGLAFTGLAATNATAELNDVRTITVSGIDRSYCIYRPDSYQEGGPAVFFFHGGGGSCNDGWPNALQAKAYYAGFLLVQPNGLDHVWNACSAPPETCSKPRVSSESENIDDIAFFDAVLAEIDTEFLPAKIYAAGMSLGGMMAKHLACHRASDLDAIAAVAATSLSESCPGGSVPFLHLHGDDDEMVPWDGQEAWWMYGWPPVLPGIEQQAFNNGCTLETSARKETKDATSYNYESCDTETVYWRYACQHGWPGYLTHRFWKRYGLWCTGSFRGEDAIWEFFQRH